MEFLINAMNAWPPEFIWLVLLIGCFGAILFLNRFFGPPGLYVYIAIAIIGANIQVLKAVKFSVYPEPVALGTILFSSSYLATDILAEGFGKDAAKKKGVWLGFIAFLSFVAIMILTLGFSPLTPEQAGEEMAWSLDYHDHMKALFTPQLAFFAAGMISLYCKPVPRRLAFPQLEGEVRRAFPVVREQRLHHALGPDRQHRVFRLNMILNTAAS